MKTTELIATVVIVLLVTVYFTLKSKKEKGSSWQGILIKKKDYTDEDDENHMYRLIFKKDDGKKAKVSVSEEMYNQAQIGDRYAKKAGEYSPSKVV